MVIPTAVGSLETVPKSQGKKTGGSENQRRNQDHPDHGIVKINQNTKKRSRDLRKLAVTQTPMKEDWK